MIELPPVAVVHRPHRDDLGDLRPLIAEIEKNGMWNLRFPCVALCPRERRWVLLGGERRFAAAIAAGQEYLKLSRIGGWADFERWAIGDMERGVGKPMLLSEAARFVEKVLDLARPPHWGGRRPWSPFLAEYTGHTVAQLGDMRRLLAVTTSEDPDVARLAARRIVQADAGEMRAATGWEHVRALMDRRNAPPGMDAGAQAKVLNNVGTQGAGLAAALESIGSMAPGHAHADRMRWRSQLGELRLQLERTIKELGRENQT